MSREGLRARPSALLALLAGAALLAGPAAAAGNDVRDLRAGMAVAELPSAGYLLACRQAPETRLPSWQDYRSCPPDGMALHEVAVRYDDDGNPLTNFNDKWEGTKLAGHPVLLTLLIGDDGVVRGLRAVTDPAARPYMKKKAFLLARQVKLHYGEDGWSCRHEPPAAGETPVGGLFVKSECEKIEDGRRLVLAQRLYRGAGQSPPDFESMVRLEVWAPAR